MSSSQTQQSDTRQLRHVADRPASESDDPEHKSDYQSSDEPSLNQNEAELSHYLHYEDNACFFAPDWQNRCAIDFGMSAMVFMQFSKCWTETKDRMW
ncbi:uncharacterized protein DSM5745_11056 [Aspergillus mulundensis]|uniref:Uncharacterized protein n=1 Tax=Aspergillus mulundensis TaxID=1810919 RepID=A0A3D8QCA7_9EURO|nr:hypothetical protein DSM5745_11056 [Aspergillus mulundensis]RDW59361.1 hypothetical protein DSM5745_11056 [Aspergillus mulundensis]